MLILVQRFFASFHRYFILNKTWHDFISYTDVLKLTSTGSIEGQVRKLRLLFAGRLERMEDHRIPKLVMYADVVAGKRERGRPHKAWKEGVRNDLELFAIEVPQVVPVRQEKITLECLRQHCRTHRIVNFSRHNKAQLLQIVMEDINNNNRDNSFFKKTLVQDLDRPSWATRALIEDEWEELVDDQHTIYQQQWIESRETKRKEKYEQRPELLRRKQAMKTRAIASKGKKERRKIVNKN